ncbi:MAG: S8 family peptidase [Bdellovibrionota bacterium]
MKLKQTKLSALVATLTVTASLLTGCGGGSIHESAKVANGPTSQENAGLVVSSVTEGDLAAAIEKDDRIKVRVINANHGIFEVYGIEKEELEKLLLKPSAKIQRNQFMRFQNLEIMKATTGPELLATGIITEKQAEAFVAPCVNNPTRRPNLKIAANGKRDLTNSGFLLTIGESITLDAAQSRTSTGTTDLEIMWVMYPNSDSQLAAQFLIGGNLAFKPDTYGEYIYIAVAKDVNNFCTISKDLVYVTDKNIPYDAANAMTTEQIAKVDMTRFWQLTSTQAIESWALSTGKDVVVAIIDSGVNYNHPALAANIFVNKKEIAGNGKDDDGNGFIDDVTGYDFGNSDGFPFDDYGHGSHCAGITASSVFGLAKNAKIMPIKVGTGPGIDVASVAGGIYYAVDNGAKVLSMSLGFELDAPALKSAIEYANQNNVVVIAAAGNGDSAGNGLDNDLAPLFPASYDYPNVISVAATSVKNEITSYSNFGLKSVDLGAPGGDEVQLVLSTYKPNPRNAGLMGMAGTSMATPAVAGAAAQVLAKNPTMLPKDLRLRLMNTGREALSLKGKTVSGKMLNSLSALK